MSRTYFYSFEWNMSGMRERGRVAARKKRTHYLPTSNQESEVFTPRKQDKSM